MKIPCNKCGETRESVEEMMAHYSSCGLNLSSDGKNLVPPEGYVYKDGKLVPKPLSQGSK